MFDCRGMAFSEAGFHASIAIAFFPVVRHAGSPFVPKACLSKKSREST
jgi:hypothetical protein